MIDILMPRLSDTMTEGTIAAWLKKPGDAVAPGDLLVEIETDKALMEQEAYDAGILAAILVAEGENVPIGTPIARLDDGAGTASPSETHAPPSENERERGGERRAATPLVRRLARERGVDLARLIGSGPGGRIVRADLDAAGHDVAGHAPAELDAAEGEPAHGTEAPHAAPPERVESEDAREPVIVDFDAIRQQIARRLTTSATTVPSFTATASADVTALLAIRSEINQQTPTEKVSVNDLLVRAVALSLRAHPDINASYSAEGRGRMLRHRRVHVGIAVASSAGLVVPVIRDADRAAVSAIARDARALIAKAGSRDLTAADMADGTFTISNLGMYGIEHFTAIINPPQGAILAVGAARDELALGEGGAVEVRTMLRLTITADHRIIDGAEAARFLATLTEILEQPFRVLA